MRNLIRFTLTAAAAATAVLGTGAAASAAEPTAASPVPCEQWYVDADQAGWWNNCSDQGQWVEIRQTIGGSTFYCKQPGLNRITWGPYDTPYINSITWNGETC